MPAVDFSLTDKVAIVTGAATGGIGEACARALAQAGASVLIADVNEEAVKAAADNLAGDGL